MKSIKKYELGFESLSNRILSKILPTFSNQNSREIDFYCDNEKEFVYKLKEISNINVAFLKRNSNHNYPSIDSISFQVLDADMNKIKSHGSDILRRPSSALAIIKAKAELLERISAALPIDIASKNEYSIDKTFNLIKDNTFKVKSIINRDYIYKKYEDIYYYLSRNVLHIDLHDTFKSNHKNTQITTNGCAGHFDYDQAVLSGWLEIVQRDSFLVYWLNSISPKVIDVDTYYSLSDISENKDTYINKDIYKILSDFKKYNIEYYFLDITSDIEVPSVLCVTISTVRGEKRLHIGACTGFDVDKVFLSAALESISCAASRHGIISSNENINNVLSSFKTREYIPFTNKNIDKEMRQNMYYPKGMIENIEFIYKSKEKISVEKWWSINDAIKKRGYDIIRLDKDVKYQLQYLKEIFKERIGSNADYNVYVYEYKNKLIKYFDFKVVRVICPALYSLYLREDYADPKHARLSEFIKNKGLINKTKINIWPHPFP